MAKLPEEIIENEYHVVVYTDGASSPNPGPSGSSLHGYIYSTEALDTKTSDKPTGYSITNNGYIPGDMKESDEVNKLVKPSYYIDGMYVHSDIVTNNVAELQAIVFTLEEILRIDYLPISSIYILSDSMYAISVFEKVQNTIDWRKDEVPNKKYYELLSELINMAKVGGVTLKIGKVKGHDISLGNNIADRLAVGARLLAADSKILINEFNIVDASQYWSSRFDRHPVLRYKQIFFLNSLRGENPSYSIINYKSDTELGSKSGEPLFGTYIPSESIPEIEEVIKVYQDGVKNQHVLIGTVDLSVLYKQRTSHYHKLFGTNIYRMNSRNTQLLVLDDEPVVYSVTPSGLPKKVMDLMAEHYNILTEYKLEKDKQTRTYLDVTDQFYALNEKGKQECTLAAGIKDMDIKVTYKKKEVTIPLCFNTDLPDRNVFKKIEKNNVVVTLVIEDLSKTAFNYYLILEDKTANDISIWNNFFSNKVLTKEEK